ncbi:hypothetical protein [Arthrobacter sp.]|uniref:hypothetical protein n=1 Tax=Arthrobacter sp. TaxID=1667 RepID=UPI002586AD4E|nr:hypothetical protein [Arthrobacter sp.]
MELVENPEVVMKWLLDSPLSDPSTGLETSDWQATTWILHAMYSVDLSYVPSPELLDRSRFYPLIDDGPLKPGNDLRAYAPDSNLTGYQGHRVLWSEYFGRTEHELARKYRPGLGWFNARPVAPAMIFPPEGSMDPVSFTALLKILDQQPTTECFVYYASLPADDFSKHHLWTGQVKEVWSLVSGEAYDFTPTNMWASDHSWFTLTNYDLQGTQVCGTENLIEQVRHCQDLETIDIPKSPDRRLDREYSLNRDDLGSPPNQR